MVFKVNELQIGKFSTVIPDNLFYVKKSGGGFGEFSVAALLSGKTSISELKPYVGNHNHKWDVSYEGYIFEVKKIRSRSSNVRANNNSRSIVYNISHCIEEIYDILTLLLTATKLDVITDINNYLTTVFQTKVNIFELLKNGQQKIRNQNYSQGFLGVFLNPKKINVKDLLIALIGYSTIHNKSNDILIPQSCELDVNVFNRDKFLSSLNKNLIAAIYPFSLDKNQFSSIYLKLGLVDRLSALQIYLSTKAISEIFSGITGIFFIIGMDEYVYVPHQQFNNIIKFAGVSQSVKVVLNQDFFNMSVYK